MNDFRAVDIQMCTLLAIFFRIKKKSIATSVLFSTYTTGNETFFKTHQTYVFNNNYNLYKLNKQVTMPGDVP